MFASDSLLPLLVLLSIVGVTAQTTEPNCNHVADFDDCQGNAPDFCPKGVPCGCKNQTPFCKCPSYRKHWQNYWYMGPKCDHLWSTLDLILVTVVPAITLSLAVAVTMQWVNYCKNKPGHRGKQISTRARATRPQAQGNPEHAHNPANKAKHVPQPQERMDDRAAQRYEIPLHSQPNKQRQPQHIEGYSYIPQRLSRTAAPIEDNPFVAPSRSQVGQLGSWEREIPDIDYEEVTPSVSMPMRQFSQLGAPAFPEPDYHEKRPFKIGRPQNMYT